MWISSRRQNLTSLDVIFWRLKTVSMLKELRNPLLWNHIVGMRSFSSDDEILSPLYIFRVYVYILSTFMSS